MTELVSTQSIDDTQLLRIKDVMRLLGISKSSVYRFVKENRLPKPLKLSARAARFRLSAINHYLDELEQSRAVNTPAIRTKPLSPVTQDATHAEDGGQQ
ncbi:MAG TPA: AlpA family phage regulatory protein [Terracidiphilus sp.]